MFNDNNNFDESQLNYTDRQHYDQVTYDETQGMGPFNDDTWSVNNSDNQGLWPRNPPKNPFDNNDDNY